MRPMLHYFNKIKSLTGPLWRFIFLLVLVLSFGSCSLVKIESEQKPLGVKELNTRVLTQRFARSAIDRIEIAADSIAELSAGDNQVQINTLYWKILTTEELGKLSFQTEPRIALMDTWAYFLEGQDSFEDPRLEGLFGDHREVAMDAVEQNIAEIEKIASSVLSRREFQEIKDFVEAYAADTPILSQSQFKHKSLRESYLEYERIPDSIALQTVGTLSEVVADASNRFSYYSYASDRRFRWRTEILLRERGIDSMYIEAKLSEIDAQFERLIQVAENSPETIDQAIENFRNTVTPIFRDLNYEIGSAMQSLSSDVQSMDLMLRRERIALDSIIQRERMALTEKADDLVETGIKNAFDGIGDTIRSLILYLILLFLIILGLPFYVGYLIGKRKPKS